ncbi:LysR family transcriptional regulator [Phenylobacterium montanum]|uniref:LysR family transcriptional regulator n=2 Tax=Phenylobacterium montanum TaxID=2823693 RepID=A0A975IWQ6_9CAUL|nr:LysR family transcriptional regulator [Caulobacter sp. S6]
MEHGSLRRASQMIGLSPAALSERIRALEEALAVSLFQRSAAGVEPTHAGAAFLGEAAQAVEQLDLAAAKALAAGKGEQGKITVGLSGAGLIPVLGDTLASFAAGHAKVGLQIVEGSRGELVKGLRKRGIDLAVLLGPPVSNLGETLALPGERLFVVSPSDHRLAHRYAIDWPDLRGGGVRVSDALAGARLGSPPCEVQLLVHRGGCQSLFAMVRLGLGLALATESEVIVLPSGLVAAPLLEHGEAVTIPVCAYRDGGNDNPPARRLWASLRAASARWSRPI